MGSSYAIRIFEENERSHLMAVVKSVLARKGLQWQEKNATEAVVIMVSPDEPGAQTLIDRMAGSSERLALVYSENNPGKTAWWLKKPATSMDVEKIFQRIEAFLATASGDQMSPNFELQSDEEKGSGLLNLLLLNRLRSEIHKTPLLLVSDGALLAHGIDMAEGRVFLGGTRADGSQDMYRLAAQQIETARAEQVKFERLGAEQMAVMRAGAPVIRLDGYLWQLGRAVTSKSLLDKTSRGASFRLKRWPDLVNANYTQEELQLCAMSSRFPVNTSLLKARLGVSDSLINGFLNGCFLMDILEMVTVNDDISTIKETRFSMPKNILSRLLTKLSA